MNILDKIVLHKKQEVQAAKNARSFKELESTASFKRECYSMSRAIKSAEHIGIISEIKRSSPSTGIIHDKVDVENLSSSYIDAGAAGLSILTDTEFFGGTTADVIAARPQVQSPILRKDFMIDEYQIVEAKSIGADCILLIAACLSISDTNRLAAFAKNLGLEILLEVHNAEEAKSHVNEHIDLIGVNNRNLKTFTTDIINSIELYELLPSHLTKISESGIYTAEQILKLKKCGYDGFLIGGSFMKTSDPAAACAALINDYKALIS